MNLWQWLVIALPVLGIYWWFVLTAETDGRIDRRGNAWAGLIVIPILSALLPAIGIGMLVTGLRRRPLAWDLAIGGLVLLGLCGLAAWLVVALGDGPPALESELQVE